MNEAYRFSCQMATNENALLFRLRYCDKRRKVLLAHVHEGYEQDLWLYSEPVAAAGEK